VAALAALVSAGAQALPNLSLAPINPDFGTGTVGVQRDITMTLTNVSAGNVQINGLNFAPSPGGVPATWSNSIVGASPCSLLLVLAPAASCTFQHSVIQNAPGVSTLVTNLAVVVVGTGDETFAYNSIANALAAPTVPVPALAPGLLALLAGGLGALGALVLRRRRGG
jgi:hypothetical protein